MLDWLIRKTIPAYQDSKKKEVRTQYGNLASVIGIVINLFLFIGKITVGLLSNSISIVADAINNISDFASSVISLLAFRFATKPADKEHPFGHGRAEYLASFLLSIFIILIGFNILRSGIAKIRSPQDASYQWSAFLVMIISILAKAWMYLSFRKVAKRIRSSTLEAAAIDSRNDVLTTSAVLLSAVLTLLFGWQFDAYLAVLVSLLIIWSGFSLVKETTETILGKSLDKEQTEAIKNLIVSHPKVMGFHKLYAHDYGPDQVFCSVHVELDMNMSLASAHKVADEVEHLIEEKLGIEMTVHVDPRDPLHYVPHD